MPLSRRGFLKAAAAGLVIVAAMPDLAAAEARRYWSLDQTMIARADQLIRDAEGTGVWDLALTPDRFSPGMWAVWTAGSLLVEAPGPVDYSMIPIEVMTMSKPEELMEHLAVELRRTVGPQAQLGAVTYGYQTRDGLLYRPIMAADRAAQS
jgi:hypothetical protein